MNKIGFVILLVVAGLVLGGWWWLHNTDERRVVRVFDKISSLAEKNPEEGLLGVASKMSALGALLDDEVTFLAPEVEQGDSLPREELVKTAFLHRSSFSALKLTFDELHVDFPAKDQAEATCDATLSGKAVGGGERFEEVRALHARLLKSHDSGDWRLHSVTVSPIVEK